MKENTLRKVEMLGQSIWLDYIRRDMIASGELHDFIKEDGLSGITSNPSIFEKAIAESNIYDQYIIDLTSMKKSHTEIYEIISRQDVQNAADEFRKMYDKTKGKEGYVSLEVNPHLAYNTKGTIDEARRLWIDLNRPNVFIKIPATLKGLPAIKQLVSEGVNINVTLIFGLSRYRQVAEAYLSGLEERISQGKPIKQLTSVASFFIGRIDSILDPLFEKLIETGSKDSQKASTVLGHVAVSSAKMAYQIYKEIFESARFKKLAEKGATAQRLLWASTGNKNPNYDDVKYVEEIIGTNTINTVPPNTINAYRDHGNPKSRLEDEIEEANRILLSLCDLGINMDEITQQLEDEGIEKFIKPYDKLIDAIKKKSLG